MVINALDEVVRAEFSGEFEEDRPVLLIHPPASDTRVDGVFDPLNVKPGAGRIILQLADEVQRGELEAAVQLLGGFIPLLRKTKGYCCHGALVLSTGACCPIVILYAGVLGIAECASLQPLDDLADRQADQRFDALRCQQHLEGDGA